MFKYNCRSSEDLRTHDYIFPHFELSVAGAIFAPDRSQMSYTVPPSFWDLLVIRVSCSSFNSFEGLLNSLDFAFLVTYKLASGQKRRSIHSFLVTSANSA